MQDWELLRWYSKTRFAQKWDEKYPDGGNADMEDLCRRQQPITGRRIRANLRGREGSRAKVWIHFWHLWLDSEYNPNFAERRAKNGAAKEVNKLQDDLNVAKSALESAKHEHKKIEEQILGSNEFLHNTNCLANYLYTHGLKAFYPTPIEHPVHLASLLLNIEW